MQPFLISVVFFLLLVLAHESGHIMSAKLFGLKIEKIGFAWKPLPHPYVVALNVPNNILKYCFLFSGPFVTIVLFSLACGFSLLAYKPLYYAFTFMIITEYNPYYSDFTIAAGTHQGEYRYTVLWFVHFMLWITLGTALIAPARLLSCI